MLAGVGVVFGGAAFFLRRIGPTILAHAIFNGVVLIIVLTVDCPAATADADADVVRAVVPDAVLEEPGAGSPMSSWRLPGDRQRRRPDPRPVVGQRWRCPLATTRTSAPAIAASNAARGGVAHPPLVVTVAADRLVHEDQQRDVDRDGMAEPRVVLVVAEQVGVDADDAPPARSRTKRSSPQAARNVADPTLEDGGSSS